ncbi:MAG: hypothetical protein FWC91_10810 [Defluviitaleaceae bacterium]|nr:hypothetical protein [Defluviitaleaceae bacterium]
MLKLLIGFGSILFFIAMIALAIYYTKQYMDEKKNDNDNHKNKTPKSSSGDVMGEIRQCINFLNVSSASKTFNIPNFNELIQGIITPLEKMIHIIEKYPNKAENMNELTEYILPLTKRLADDYSFYYRLSKDENNSKEGNNSVKAMEKCTDGLYEIKAILNKKVNSMLEDQFYDIHAEVAVLLQLHQE